MADARLFAKLDLGYFDNPKIADFIEDHPHAIFLHLRAILYCRQHLTDGHFPVRIVCRMVSATYCGSECESECDYCRAAAAGLFERVDTKTGNVHDYLDHQDSAEQVQNRSRAGRKGAHSRWSEARDADRNADRNADTNAEERRGEQRKDFGTREHENESWSGVKDGTAKSARRPNPRGLRANAGHARMGPPKRREPPRPRHHHRELPRLLDRRDRRQSHQARLDRHLAHLGAS